MREIQVLRSKNLPGLAGSTQSQVLEAMKLHAGLDGVTLDRQAFSIPIPRYSSDEDLTTTITSAVKFKYGLLTFDDTVHRVLAPDCVLCIGFGVWVQAEGIQSRQILTLK
jgi:hypothetical protein